MYVALDSIWNRLYDDEQKYTECFCQDCGTKLSYRVEEEDVRICQ